MTASEHLDGHTILPSDFSDWADEVSAIADNSLQLGGDIDITDPTNDHVLWVDVVDDSSSTSNWQDRIRIRFGTRMVGWFNEYGEIRGMPAKINTVAARWFGALNETEHGTRNPADVVLEVVDDRVRRNPMFTINHVGDVLVAGDLDVGGEVTGTNIGIPIKAVLDHDESPDSPTTGDIYLVRPEP